MQFQTGKDGIFFLTTDFFFNWGRKDISKVLNLELGSEYSVIGISTIAFPLDKTVAVSSSIRWDNTAYYQAMLRKLNIVGAQ